MLDNPVLTFGVLIINNVQETGGLDKSNCHLRVVFLSTTVSTGRILFLDLKASFFSKTSVCFHCSFFPHERVAAPTIHSTDSINGTVLVLKYFLVIYGHVLDDFKALLMETGLIPSV